MPVDQDRVAVGVFDDEAARPAPRFVRTEITGSQTAKKTLVVARLTTKGSGAGTGNVGVSVVLAFCLGADVSSITDGRSIRLPAQGKLVASGGLLSTVDRVVAADLAAAGAASKTYTGLAGAGSSDSFFHGFALYDPTNAGSLRDAYFEFSGSESEGDWSLKPSE